MAITKPKSRAAAAEAFIAGAPDATPEPPRAVKGVTVGHKRQITLTISPELLAQVDELAARIGQSRASTINLAIRQAIDRGLSIEGLRRSE